MLLVGRGHGTPCSMGNLVDSLWVFMPLLKWLIKLASQCMSFFPKERERENICRYLQAKIDRVLFSVKNQGIKLPFPLYNA